MVGTDLLQCPFCFKVDEANTWDIVSRKECKTREQKRTFKSVLWAYKKGRYRDYYYKCSGCGEWVMAGYLIYKKDKQYKASKKEPRV